MKQNRILSGLLAGLLLCTVGVRAEEMGAQTTVTTIELPKSAMKLVLPEGMKAEVDRYDEYTDREMVVYFISPPYDDKGFLMSLTTIRKESYQGKTLQDLQDQELNDIIAELTTEFGEGEMCWLYTDEGIPMLLIHDRLNPEEFSDYILIATNFYSLIAMKDSWLLKIMTMDSKGAGPVDQLLTSQVRFMESLLTGDDAAPTFETKSFLYPTLTGNIILEVPYGYHMMPYEDSLLLIDLQSFSKRYVLSFSTAKNATIDAHWEGLEQFAKSVEDSIGEPVKMERIEEGFLGVPMIILYIESRAFYMMYLIKDGCMIDVGVQSHRAPVIQEDIARMEDLLRFVEGQP